MNSQQSSLLPTRKIEDFFDSLKNLSQNIQDLYCSDQIPWVIGYSGGKDSTVLLHLVRSIYPDVPAVFVDTGLEYPEIREFVKSSD